LDNTKANILDYQRAILSDGPSFYWPLATSSGTGAPWQSIAGITSVVTSEGSPTNTGALIQNGGGVVGDTQSRDFDGIDDALLAPASLAHGFGYGGYSFEAWVRPQAIPSPGNYGMVISHQGEVTGGAGIFGVANFSGDFRWAFRGAYQLSPPLSAEPIIFEHAPVVDTTYHIVAVWEPNVLKFYVNGVKVHETDYGDEFSPHIFHPNLISIGRYAHFPSHYFDGLIDEPAVYGYPLSDEQVLAHYKTGTNVL